MKKFELFQNGWGSWIRTNEWRSQRQIKFSKNRCFCPFLGLKPPFFMLFFKKFPQFSPTKWHCAKLRHLFVYPSFDLSFVTAGSLTYYNKRSFLFQDSSLKLSVTRELSAGFERQEKPLQADQQRAMAFQVGVLSHLLFRPVPFEHCSRHIFPPLSVFLRQIAALFLFAF